MDLSDKQRGVLRGMAVGAVVAVTLVALGISFNPFGYGGEADMQLRIELAATASLGPALFLAVAIGRLAKHRFFTPADIDGGGLGEGTQKAKLLQAVLQNTLEQSVLSVMVWMMWCLVAPDHWLSVVPLAVVAFALGRLMFFAGYEQGAPARSLGFVLSFYPSLVMLVALLGYRAIF